jgi:hypothetical protein
MIKVGNAEYHLRDLFFEIFKMGLASHESFKENDSSIQIQFEYWLKEKSYEDSNLPKFKKPPPPSREFINVETSEDTTTKRP